MPKAPQQQSVTMLGGKNIAPQTKPPQPSKSQPPAAQPPAAQPENEPETK